MASIGMRAAVAATGPNWTVGTRIGKAWTETGEHEIVFEGGSYARYSPTGHLVYTRAGALLAVPFDLDTLTTSGGPVPLLQGVMRGAGVAGANNEVANYSVSDNGTLIYVKGNLLQTARELVWVDREGREEPIAAPVRSYTYPRISPDGARIALDIRDEEFDIWTWDLARESLTPLTSGEIRVFRSEFWWRTRSAENTTSSAVKSLPLWNLTPLRRWKRQRVGSTISQRSASAGRISSFGPRRVSPS